MFNRQIPTLDMVIAAFRHLSNSSCHYKNQKGNNPEILGGRVGAKTLSPLVGKQDFFRNADVLVWRFNSLLLPGCLIRVSPVT